MSEAFSADDKIADEIIAGEIIAGEIVINTPSYSLHQLSVLCDVHHEYLVDLIALGIINAEGDHPSHWLFSYSAVLRINKAMRLQRDFALDQQGLALALELLDEIERLRIQVARLTPSAIQQI